MEEDERPCAKKHTLDSDEEDEEQVREKYDVRQEIEGEEEGEARHEQEIQITPFNMKEELEEGHFDKEGMYIFDKETHEVKDHWLDNIDWVKVEERAQVVKPDEQSPPPLDKQGCYRRMLPLLQPGETVQQAIRRLGHSPNRSSKRTRASPPATTSTRQQMMQLIALADQLVTSGDMDAYEHTYEHLAFHLRSSDSTPRPAAPAGVDMFAEEETPAREQVSWHLRWEEGDEAPVHGPFTTTQMIQWRDAGYFAGTAFVRQEGKEGSFHPVARIDFDLYS